MKRAAFLTYNAIGKAGAHQNGWKERGENKALIIQNPRLRMWAAGGSAEELIGEIMDDKKTLEEQKNGILTGRVSAIYHIFAELLDYFDEIDELVIYVGSLGAELAIVLASQFLSIRGGKEVTFVMCDCYKEEKVAMLNRVNLKESSIIWSECGGHRKMEELLIRFLETGQITETPSN